MIQGKLIFLQSDVGGSSFTPPVRFVGVPLYYLDNLGNTNPVNGAFLQNGEVYNMVRFVLENNTRPFDFASIPLLNGGSSYQTFLPFSHVVLLDVSNNK